VPLEYERVPGDDAVNVYVTLQPLAASVVSTPWDAVAHAPVWPGVAEAVTWKPGKRMEVLPAGAGSWFNRLTVTVWPSVTISVGPGTCIGLQNVVVIAAGAKPVGG
jgi:hypothetical protein